MFNPLFGHFIFKGFNNGHIIFIVITKRWLFNFFVRIINSIEITYDLEKNAKNVLERDLSFSKVAYFNWYTATLKEDQRKNYLEQRFEAIGYLEDRLHVLCFSETN